MTATLSINWAEEPPHPIKVAAPLLLLPRANRCPYVHFDTRQFAHIPWNDPADLATRLEARIRAIIGQEPRLALVAYGRSGRLAMLSARDRANGSALSLTSAGVACGISCPGGKLALARQLLHQVNALRHLCYQKILPPVNKVG